MIQSISAQTSKTVVRAGADELVQITLTATFEAPGETDTLDVFSAHSRGSELAPRSGGPFQGSSLVLVLPPADGSSQSTRNVWVRVGEQTGIERIYARSRAASTVEARVDLEIEPDPTELKIEEYNGDAVLSGVTSFFRFFRDTDLLRAAWHGMANEAGDVDSRLTVVDKSARIFEMPILTSKRWQGFDFNDEIGVHDSQVLVFQSVEGGDHGFGNESPDTNNLAYWNATNNYDVIEASSPSAFVVLPGTTGFGASDRDDVDEEDGAAWFKTSSTSGAGVVSQQEYSLTIPTQSLVSLELNLVVRAWGTVADPCGAVAEVWNVVRQRWEEIGRQTPAASAPAYADLGTVLFGDDLLEYVSGSGKVKTRVRTDQASGGVLSPVRLGADRFHLWAGVTGRTGAPLVSPGNTTVHPDTTKFAAYDVDSDEVYEEDVDFFIDYDRSLFIWLRRVDSRQRVRVFFHEDLPYVYQVDEDLIGLPELRDTVLAVPKKRLVDGQDFSVFEPGRIRTKIKRHRSGATSTWWANVSLHDDETIFRNFGVLTERFTDERSSLRYLRQVQALWYAFWSGPTIYNVQAGAQILMNAPFAFTRTRVATIVGNTITLENGQIATKPPNAAWSVVPGEEVAQYQPLSTGVRVADKVSDPLFAVENDDTSGFVNSELIYEGNYVSEFAGGASAAIMASAHLFTAEIDGFILGQSGADASVIERFVNAIKPVHTAANVTIVLGSDCGEVIEGPCGPRFADEDNCFCDIVGSLYSECPTFFTYLNLDVSQYLARHPYSNRRLSAVPDLAALQALADPKPGDTVPVTSEGRTYVFYAPQVLGADVQTADFGVYFDEVTETFEPIVPNIFASYPLETWSVGALEEVPAGTHDVGQPPFDQWQWGGRWIPSIGTDLPLLSSHKADLDLNKSPDAGRSEDRFFGTAFDNLGTGIASQNSTRYEEVDARTVQAAEPYGLVGGPLSNAPVVSVRRAWARLTSGSADVSSDQTTLIDPGASFLSVVQVGDLVRNETEGTFAWVEAVVSDTELTTTNDDPESPDSDAPLSVSDPVVSWSGDTYRVVRRIPNHEFTFDRLGNVNFDAVHAGSEVDFTYLQGSRVIDDPGGADPATRQYLDRWESEMPATVGQSWSNYDETYDLDDDTVGVTDYAVQYYVELEGDIIELEEVRDRDNGDGPGFDFGDVEWTTIHGFFPTP